MEYLLLLLLLRSFVACSGQSGTGRVNTANETPATNTPSFITQPMNITVRVGKSAVLPCRVKDLNPFLVVWRREKDKYILYAGDFKIIKDSRFRVDVNMTALYIDDVKVDDSSEYTCQVGTVPPKEITHQLTVTGPSADSSALYDTHCSSLQLVLALLTAIFLIKLY